MDGVAQEIVDEHLAKDPVEHTRRREEGLESCRRKGGKDENLEVRSCDCAAPTSQKRAS